MAAVAAPLLSLALAWPAALPAQAAPESGNGNTPLPRVTLAELLPPELDPPEAWLVQDGAAGWFLIEDAAAAAGVTIGISPALLPPFAPPPSEGAVPMICDDGASVTALRVVTAQTVFQTCLLLPSHRPDLSDLTALGRPVLVDHHWLDGLWQLDRMGPWPNDEILRVSILDDRRPAGPGAVQEMVLSLPWVWHPALSDLPEPRSHLAGLAAALESTGLDTVHIRIETAPERPRPDAPPISGEKPVISAPVVSAPVISAPGGPRVLDALSRIERYHLLVTCAPEICARTEASIGASIGAGTLADTIPDLAPLFRLGRDRALLDHAVEAGRTVPFPRSQSGGRPPDLTDLHHDQTRLSGPRTFGMTILVIRRHEA